jgi:hypothetical protein
VRPSPTSLRHHQFEAVARHDLAADVEARPDRLQIVGGLGGEAPAERSAQ